MSLFCVGIKINDKKFAEKGLTGMENVIEVIINSNTGFTCCAKRIPLKEKWVYSTKPETLTKASMRGVPKLEVVGISTTKGLDKRVVAAQELFELIEYVVYRGINRSLIDRALNINRADLIMVMTTAWAFNYDLDFYRKCANIVINIWTSGNYAIYDEAIRTIKREINTKLIA